jgi:hypothetical protein
VFRAFALLFRIAYLLAALTALVVLAPWLVDSARAAFTPHRFADHTFSALLVASLLLAGFIVPSASALLRLSRSTQLLPDSRLRAAPVLSMAVLLACVLGTALLLFVAWVVCTTWPEERHGANLAAPACFGLMLLAFALLTGECVLAPGPAKQRLF